MFFKKKSDNKDCPSCNSSIDKKFSFCPHCGFSLLDKEKEIQDFGMLGKNDINDIQQPDLNNFGITDKLINSIFNSLVKSLDKQIKSIDPESLGNGTEIKNFPNGVRIKIAQGPLNAPQNQQRKPRKLEHSVEKKQLTEEQIKKISKLPRTEAKTNVRRLSNKVIYELSAPGVESIEDIFLSKTESGYEIKAIGNKKVYINNIPINLPLRSFSTDNTKIFIEFLPEENQ